MEDIIQHNNVIYIKASSSLADQRTRVIKHGELFGIYDVFGDSKPVGTGAQGLYKESTRYLSQMELRVAGRYPLFLSSTINSDNTLFTVDLSNPDANEPSGAFLHRGTFHIFRNKFLSDEACYERIQVTNFSNEPKQVEISLHFSSDFVDMFEIRGIPREKRGKINPPAVNGDNVIFSYDGLDEKIRFCRIQFYPAPKSVSDSEARFLIDSAPGERTTLFITTSCYENAAPNAPALTYHSAFSRVESWSHRHAIEGCRISASSERFNAWFARSRSDILLMLTETDSGPYPYAGIPWFNTVFGRDGIITAMQYLWIHPGIARGVLSYLAKHQSSTDLPGQDAEPGKILHEFRKGEMVDTGEVPFKNYYGSADATPLFIVLAGRYFEWTNDRPFIEQIWPAIEAALKWIDDFGDLDGDGFIEYHRRAPKGLVNQGWKDSNDSISHSDGTLADGPIALAEVQGYVYDAKLQAAKMARHLGHPDLATRLTTQAARLREKFHEKFWNAEMGLFALALDGKKNPCAVKSSNAGHCLFSQIANRAQATKVAEKLLLKDMFTGWGIRTLSQAEVRYNPMSYHNGSVWPHDNAMIAEGFARYGFKDQVLQVFSALFDVGIHMDLYRLPELFCGFSRRHGEGPTLYPVACSPQAWAAGSPFMLLQASLGLEVNALENRIAFHYPVLPPVIKELRIQNLKTPQANVDLLLRRHGSEISVYVEKRIGDIEITINK